MTNATAAQNSRRRWGTIALYGYLGGFLLAVGLGVGMYIHTGSVETAVVVTKLANSVAIVLALGSLILKETVLDRVVVGGL